MTKRKEEHTMGKAAVKASKVLRPVIAELEAPFCFFLCKEEKSHIRSIDFCRALLILTLKKKKKKTGVTPRQILG